MKLLLKYFWLIGIIIGLINVFYAKSKLKEFSQRGDDEKAELDTFLKWYGICFTVPFLFLELFQLLGGYNTAFYILTFDLSNPMFVAGLISLIAYWMLLIYLVVVRNGATMIAKYRKGFSNIPDNPKLIKIFTVGICLIGFVATVFGHFYMNGVFAEIETMVEKW